ncbi:hypothetical protein Gpo141_00012758 [Globisporangium polare]
MMHRVLRLRRRARGELRLVAPPPQPWTTRQTTLALSGARQLHHALQSRSLGVAQVLESHLAMRQLNTRLLSSSTTALDTKTAVTQEALVQELKTMCNAIRNDLREAPPAQEIVDSWRSQVGAFQEQLGAANAPEESTILVDAIRLGYESAIAIASKQRQFALASALFEQMKAFRYVPTDATFQYVVRGVALELISRPYATSVEDLRAIVSDNTWERDLLEIIRSEEYAHHRKTPVERKLFHQQLLEGIETHLNDYEATLPLAERSPLPYNEALRVYAANGLPFARMLKLMVKRSVKPDVETYAALLQGARWSEIPATLSQLLQSGLVEKLASATEDEATCVKNSHSVHLIWTNTMKAIVNSYKNRFFDRKEPVSHTDVEELKKVFLYTDKQLKRAFPKFQFATSEHHEQVYTIRAKAAATAGLRANVMSVLEEYVRLAPAGAELKKDAFLCAIELYPSTQLEILHLPRELVQERAMHRDVTKSSRVSELERVYSRIANKVLPGAIAKLETMKLDPATDKNALEEQKKTVAANTRMEKALERRLNNARIVKSYQLVIQEQFERADKAMDVIQEKLLDAVNHGKDAEGDLDVQLKLMEQYMTCANRFEQRLRSRQKEVAPQLMRRVFRVIKKVSAQENVGELDREKLSELFHLAIRTAILFWRYDDAGKLVRKKKSVLKSALLDAREYELLIFKEVTDRNIRGAYALVQEMHNAGLAPPKEAIHRIVLGLLHQLSKYPETIAANEGNLDLLSEVGDHDDEAVGNEEEAQEDDELLKSSDTQTIEDELSFHDELQFDDDKDDSAEKLILGAGAPTSVMDIAGFLQDWYNLHGIRPAAKTVVPVFARLLSTRDFPEFKRLLQILESMEGGLTPATTVWLEKRLARIGKTLDDFRVVAASRR